MDQNTNPGATAQDMSLEDQKRLSQPLIKQDGLSAEDQTFLQLVMSKVESGEIKLLIPSTLINQTVYAALSPENQGKVDFEAVNLLSDIRNIYNLWNLTQSATYQVENMVNAARLKKENLENISGDIFII